MTTGVLYGNRVGILEGKSCGCDVTGWLVGRLEGFTVGNSDGDMLGFNVGAFVTGGCHNNSCGLVVW